MILKKDFPILEFDPSLRAKIEPSDVIKKRNAPEGCVTVEMEAAAFFAVSKFRNVVLGQILHGGDDLSGIKWDAKDWVRRENLRINLVDLSMTIRLKL